MRADTIETVDRAHSQADVDEVEHHEVRVAVLHERSAMGRVLQYPIAFGLLNREYTYSGSKGTHDCAPLVRGLCNRSGSRIPCPMGRMFTLRLWLIRLSCWLGGSGPDVRSTLHGNFEFVGSKVSSHTCAS